MAERDPVLRAVEELIRSYKMNWAALKIIHRADRALGVGTDTSKAVRGAAGVLFNADTNATVGSFANLRDAEILIRREASAVYGSVTSAGDAAARFDRLLKEIGKS